MPDEAQFCNKCGNKIEDKDIKCVSCGAEIPKGSQFCHICGTKIESPETSQPTKPIEKQEDAKIEQNYKPNSVSDTETKSQFITAKGISIVLGIVLILILAIGSLSVLPLLTISQEIQVPYQEAVQTQVPLKYSDSGSWGGHLVSLTNWEVTSTVSVTNTDTNGGTFSVYIIVYDGGRSAYTSQSQTKYIYPGSTVTFDFQSEGLSYSTDYLTRYSVTEFVTPPTKTVTNYVTKYRTEYQSKSVTLIQYLTGS